MALNVSILNPIHFVSKAAAGAWLNDDNTLHANRVQGDYSVLPYCQKFNLNDDIVLQFSSDSDTLPVLIAYCDGDQIEEVTGGLTKSVYGTEGEKHYFNFTIEAGNDYENKIINFELSQGTDEFESDPIFVYDMAADKITGSINKISYFNFDRDDTEMGANFVDFESLNETPLFFYIEAQSREANDKATSEILDGAQRKTIISASLFPGNICKTEGVPKYMFRRMQCASILDYFAINEKEYVVDGAVTAEMFGNSTLMQLSIPVIEANAIGINVDNLKYEVMAGLREIKPEKYTNKISDFEATTPENYNVHFIQVEHSATSSGNEAVITCGETSGGVEYIVAENGIIDDPTIRYNFEIHDSPAKLYFTIAGTGVKLDVTIHYNYNV